MDIISIIDLIAAVAGVGIASSLSLCGMSWLGALRASRMLQRYDACILCSHRTCGLVMHMLNPTPHAPLAD